MAETVASPLTVIEGQKDLLRKIKDVVEAENVEAIVLGLPLNMDDTVGSQAKLVFQFGEQLGKILDIPVHFQHERLITYGDDEK